MRRFIQELETANIELLPANERLAALWQNCKAARVRLAWGRGEHNAEERRAAALRESCRGSERAAWWA